MLTPLTTELPKDINFLLYGDPGMGKTYQIGSLGKLGKVAVLSFDYNKLNTIAGIPNIEKEYFQVSDLERDASATFTRLSQTLDELAKLDPYPYIATCLDSYTYLADIIQGHILTLSGRWSIYKDPKMTGMKGVEPGFRMADYGTHADLSENILRKLFALPGYKVLTSHSRVVINDETKAILFLPASFGQKFPQSLPGYFNEVYRCTVIPGTSQKLPEYRLQTKSDAQWGAKSGMNVFDKQANKNVSILDMFETNDLAGIITKYRARRKELGYAD